MNKLNSSIDRFCYRHPRFGIPGLMRYLSIAQALVYVLYLFSNYSAISFLTFDLTHFLHGELWRAVTFLFVPSSLRPLSFVISLMCYYTLGTILEREWGTAKFSLYYFSGAALTLIAASIASLLMGMPSATVASSYYLNMTLFLAFAVLYPETTFFLIIIPLKAKWLAALYGVLLCWEVVGSLLVLNLPGAVLPLISLLNFLVFFWPEMTGLLGLQRQRFRHQTSHQTIQFKSAVRQQQTQQAAQGYRHKCTVCGRTDADNPSLEFRYCSKCAGYHCYCQDHIFNHTHFTQ